MIHIPDNIEELSAECFSQCRRAFLECLLEMTTSASSRLLRLWDDSLFEYPEREPLGPTEAPASEFSDANLKRVLGHGLSDLKFRFWQSHSKQFDTRVTNLILMLTRIMFCSFSFLLLKPRDHQCSATKLKGHLNQHGILITFCSSERMLIKRFDNASNMQI